MRRAHKIKAAFTLVELMVVIVIMGVLFGASYFLFSSGFEAGERAMYNGRQLSGMMEGAFRYKKFSRQFAWIEYDIDNQRVRLYTQARLDDGDSLDDVRRNEEEFMEPLNFIEFGNPDNELGSAIWLEGVQSYEENAPIQDGVRLIRFDPAGSSNGHIVYIRHRALGEGDPDEYVTVDFNPITGLASIHQFYKAIERSREE